MQNKNRHILFKTDIFLPPSNIFNFLLPDIIKDSEPAKKGKSLPGRQKLLMITANAIQFEMKVIQWKN